MRIKKNIALILFSFILLAALPVFAQEFAPPASPTSFGKQKFPTGLSPQEKRELLQQRLQSITDARKANQVLNISDKLTEINSKVTQQFADALDRMSSVLDRLAVRLEEAKSQGLDTNLAEQAFTDAKTSLKTAQDAVASQSAKVYTIEASDSAALKSGVGNAISQLQSDLREVYTLVVEAKQKIAKLISELAQTGVGKIGQRERKSSSEPALLRPVINP